MVAKTRFTHKIHDIGIGKDSYLSVVIIGSKPNHLMRGYGPPYLIKDKKGETILENQVKVLKAEFPQIEIVVVGGFEFDKLLKSKTTSIRLVENQLYEESNDIEDLRLGINNSQYDNVLVLFSDIYFNNLTDICLKSTLLVDGNEKLTENDIGTTIVDNKATILSMGIESPKWAKVAFFTDKESKLLRQFISNRANGKLFLWEAINFILERGGQFNVKFAQKNDILVHVENSKQLERI